MDNNTFPVANLPADQLQKVQSLEEELRRVMNEKIVLIAYEENE
ncbi:hypothetical protein [Ammoniphilus sp. 3BR4]